MRKINPNEAKNLVDLFSDPSANRQNIRRNFPIFLEQLNIKKFRHLEDLTLKFQHPITSISGVNRSGKTSILMMLACSHLNFEQPNRNNGEPERRTWSDLMRFTKQDPQLNDWEYEIIYRKGDQFFPKTGRRKASTKKWSGVGKKESQFKERSVRFLDLDRTIPARSLGPTAYTKARKASPKDRNDELSQYLSYIFELEINTSPLSEHQNNTILAFSGDNSQIYSSFNSASGEDVLSIMLTEIIDAPEKALILIDEVETGLHPSIQRRFIDILYHEAKTKSKQFILTTHSPSIISALPRIARLHIDRDNLNNKLVVKSQQSTIEILSSMDSDIFSLMNIYCEDDTAKKIIKKTIEETIRDNHLSNLISVMKIGSAAKTYECFQAHKKVYELQKENLLGKVGYACILDGDQRTETKYTASPYLSFLPSDKAPEVLLMTSYLKTNPNDSLTYHVKNSNSHVLFKKMQKLNLASSEEEAFNKCWEAYYSSSEGAEKIKELGDFILNALQKFRT